MPHAIIGNELSILHVPKCGGQYVIDLLEANGVSHKKSSMYAEPHGCLGYINRKKSSHNINSELNNVKYALILRRDPLDWYRSFWAYRMENRHTPLGWRDDVPFDILCGDDDFNVFIDNVICFFRNGFYRQLIYDYTRPILKNPPTAIIGDLKDAFGTVRHFVNILTKYKITHDIKLTHVTKKEWKNRAVYTDKQEQRLKEIEYGICC